LAEGIYGQKLGSADELTEGQRLELLLWSMAGFVPVGKLAGMGGKLFKPVKKVCEKMGWWGKKFAEQEETLATGYKGRKGFELKNLKIQPVRNKNAIINGREYSGHALDQMQNRGLMPTVIEDAIRSGIVTKDPIVGRVRYYSQENKVTVVIEEVSGRVVTTLFGKR